MGRWILISLIVLFPIRAISQNEQFDYEGYKYQRIAERLYNSAVEAINRQDYYGALFYLDSVLSLKPDFAEAFIERGKIYYTKERKEDALNEFHQALYADPDNGEAAFFEAYVRFTMDTSSVNSDDFTEAIKNRYALPHVYYYRGVLSLLDKRYNDAIADFTLAIDQKANYAKAYHDRGTAKRLLGDYQGAIYDYRLAITYDPELIMSYINMGSTKKKIGDFQGAEQDFTVAINVDSTNFVAYNNRGGARYILGKIEEAKADFQKAYDLNPISYTVMSNLGNIAAKSGDYEAALDWYNQSLETNPEYGLAYLNRGLTLEMLGMLTEACSDWQRASELGIEEADEYLKECKE
ncbi:MAG: tetratricopeptide repeat protein [Bacteroidales bacterium]|nr:tetratricopeptide repeat protein [Bacteroidales bacterium]